jgi:hypothetical protein
MASKQLIKTFLDRRINFHLIRVAKIQRERNPKKINISYNKEVLTTRYDRQSDGSYLPQKHIEIHIIDYNISYNTEKEFSQDIKFLKTWSVNIEHE